MVDLVGSEGRVKGELDVGGKGRVLHSGGRGSGGGREVREEKRREEEEEEEVMSEGRII
jgi:hypothetical protein